MVLLKPQKKRSSFSFGSKQEMRRVVRAAAGVSEGSFGYPGKNGAFLCVLIRPRRESRVKRDEMMEFTVCLFFDKYSLQTAAKNGWYRVNFFDFRPETSDALVSGFLFCRCARNDSEREILHCVREDS